LHSAPPNAGRRLFLKQTLFTSALLVLGGGGAWLATEPAYQPPTVPLKALNGKEFGILSAWLDRLIPQGSGQAGAVALGIPAKFDTEISNWSEQHQSDFKQLLMLFEDFGLLVAGFPGRFTRMDANKQDRYLENWMTSQVQVKKEGFMVVKLIGQFLYYCQDETWPMTGYPGPFDPRFRRPAYDAIESQGA
jgi:hypothetical protein